MPHTLLLADDSVTIRRVIELTFADESVRVVSVTNGRDALARIESDRPDIVLADVGMPDVSGYDISTFVKSRPDLRHIAVVLLAGAFDPLDEARARKSGSDGVLVKPFEPQLVVNRVRELLSAPAKPFKVPQVQQVPPVAAASREAAAEAQEGTASPGAADDLVFDASLDRLDNAFASTGTVVPALNADAATNFANDLRELRSSTRPDSGGFERHEFGDWDLPPRPAEAPRPEVTPEMAHELLMEPAMPDSFESFQQDLQASQSLGYDAPPATMHQTTRPAPLPPPVTLAPKPAPAVFAPRSVVATPAPAPVAAHAPAPASSSPLADAFTSLLAAEEGRPHTPVRQAVQASLPAGTALTDEAMDLIVDRVIARLGSGVRGAVIDLAERLVRAEIDRLKAIR